MTEPDDQPLADYADALTQYRETLAGLDRDDVEAATDALDTFKAAAMSVDMAELPHHLHLSDILDSADDDD